MSEAPPRVPVELLLYDVSRGASWVLGKLLPGQSLGAMYHSSVLVFDTEYWYCGHICMSRPTVVVKEQFGPPVQTSTMKLEPSSYMPALLVVRLGWTICTRDDFHAFLSQRMAVKYRHDNYDALSHNCNAFTNDAVNFLTGRDIPEAVQQLPEYVLNMPMVRRLWPKINNWLKNGRASLATEIDLDEAAKDAGNDPCVAPPRSIQVILECTRADDGLDVMRVPREDRTIVFQLESNRGPGRIYGAVGQAYQPRFFERLVPRQERRSWISGVHFELSWDRPFSATLTLRKTSDNQLLVNNIPVGQKERVAVRNGAMLAFSAPFTKTSDGAARILDLSVSLSISQDEAVQQSRDLSLLPNYSRGDSPAEGVIDIDNVCDASVPVDPSSDTDCDIPDDIPTVSPPPTREGLDRTLMEGLNRTLISL